MLERLPLCRHFWLNPVLVRVMHAASSKIDFRRSAVPILLHTQNENIIMLWPILFGIIIGPIY